MGDLTGLIAVCAIFGVPALFLLGKSEIGRALADRIRHGEGGHDQALAAEVDDLRQRLGEVEDRLDFAERQLTSGGNRSDVKNPVA